MSELNSLCSILLDFNTKVYCNRSSLHDSYMYHNRQYLDKRDNLKQSIVLVNGENEKFL